MFKYIITKNIIDNQNFVQQKLKFYNPISFNSITDTTKPKKGINGLHHCKINCCNITFMVSNPIP